MGNNIESFKYIKEKFPFYLSSGIICAILIFMMVVLNNYRGHIHGNLADMNKIALNKNKIKLQVKEIDTVAGFLKEEFDMDASNINPDVLIFNALDEIKKNFGDSSVRISNFVDSDGGRAQNFDIEVPVKDYSELVVIFQYLEAFRIPKYKTTNFSLDNRESGKMLLIINGKFLMPSF